MSYGSRTVSYKTMNAYREDGSKIMVMRYEAAPGIFHYELYSPSLKYTKREGKYAECSGYYPMFPSNRFGCLRGDTLEKLIADGILVDKTPKQTQSCYRFYGFPEQELNLYGGVFAD